MSSKRGGADNTARSKDATTTKQNQFHSIIDRLKTAAASDRAAYDALTLEDARSRLDASRRIGFNVTASLEIEQARKRQLVETFLKHEMQLPTIEKSDDEDANATTREAEDALEASLRGDEKEGKDDDEEDGVGDDDIVQLKRRLVTSQLEARKNLRLAKRTRRLCDAMVQMLKDKGVEQLEPPRAL